MELERNSWKSKQERIEKHIMCLVRLNPTLLTDMTASLLIEDAIKYMTNKRLCQNKGGLKNQLIVPSSSCNSTKQKV